MTLKTLLLLGLYAALTRAATTDKDLLDLITSTSEFNKIFLGHHNQLRRTPKLYIDDLDEIFSKEELDKVQKDSDLA